MPPKPRPRPAAADELTTAAVWDGLLNWLGTIEGGSTRAVRSVRIVDTKAGRGLVADGPVPPSTPLITIPTRALVNTTTLRPHYPDSLLRALTSTQFISLHLALQTARHADGRPKTSTSRDFFQPFLRSLPLDFPTVPLMWAIRSKPVDDLRSEYDLPESDTSLAREVTTRASRLRFHKLLDLMPPSVRVRAHDVEGRFKADWRRVCQVWTCHCLENSDESDSLLFADYLLGWLNVNTRCVFWDLGGKTSDSLTLAPIIDMINHRVGQLTKPLQNATSLSFSSPAYGSPDPQLVDGAELGFSYGAHEDPMLLTEYGFVLGNQENPFNNVSLDEEVAEMFETLGEEGTLKQGLLMDEGYWGEMTLQAGPPPASASWRVLIALRLFHLRVPRRTTSFTAAAFEPWFEVLSGTAEMISDTNEDSVRADVTRMAKVIAYNRSEGVKACDAVEREWKLIKGLDVERECLGMLKGVWEGERTIAAAVLQEGIDSKR